MKHLKTWITILVLVALAGGYTAWMVLQPGPAVEAISVTSGTIRSYVEERARTTLPRVFAISMPLDGRIEPILIEPGTTVNAGDVVARMDTEALDTAVSIAQAELDQIDAQITLLKDNAIANTALNEAKGWIATMDKLSVSAQDVIKSNQDHSAFADWWKDAEEKLKAQGAIAESQYRRASVESSEAAVDLAVSKLNHDIVLLIKQIFELGPRYVLNYLNLKTLKEAVLVSQRQGAVAQLAQAKRDRDRAEIKAPVSGIVLTRIVQSEQVLPAGTELLTIGETDTLQVTADILSQDASRIRPGDPVDVFGSAIGERALKGQVIRVHPQAFTKVSSLGVDQQRVAVDIAFAEGELTHLKAADHELGVDYRVQVRVYTDEAPDALIIPRMALFRGDDPAGEGTGGDNWHVYRVADGNAVETSVELGLGNDEQVQVTKGLSEGDLVIIAPPKDLVAGAKVTPSRS